MNVEVTMPNGEKSYPIYAPEHKVGLVKFYAEYVEKNPTAKVVITDDNGNVVLDI